MADVFPVRRLAHLLALAVLLVGLFLYLYRIDRWLMDDDEGGFCYAAWRISEGEVPYCDFLTEQVPLFLYGGAVLVRIFGPSVMPLRFATVLATLLAALVVYITMGQICGSRVALLFLPLFLLHKDVYLIARFFRPEAYMLLCSAVGMYAFWHAKQASSRRSMVVSGALFGLAMLIKLFAAWAAAGCVLFLLWSWFRSRERQALLLIMPFVAGLAVIVGTVFMAFQWRYPVFLDALFRLHLLQGADLGVVQVVAKGLGFFWNYIKGNPVLVLLAIWGAARALATPDPGAAYLAWQLPTAASFLLLSRSLQDRHLVYLVPALCVLAALSLDHLLAGDGWLLPMLARGEGVTTSRRWILLGVGLLALALAILPSWGADLDVASWNDDDTLQLAQYIQATTRDDDIVLSEYNELNFHALRKNTYLAADLSNVTASTGLITGAALVRELNENDVQMVWINTVGGASHLVYLRDYEVFYRFVQGHYFLVRQLQRDYETFEVYGRTDVLPMRPGVDFGGSLALTGADLGVAKVSAGSEFPMVLRWQAVEPMERDFSVSVRLLDADGNRCCQQDGPLLRRSTSLLPGGSQEVYVAGTSHWPKGQQVLDRHELLVGSDTRTGTYSLALVVYELSSGDVLLARDAAGQALGTEIPLATVQVTSPASR
jgi:4-amino-4-deoxy-L-arabinose transferase-like glycosyltransferase